MDEKFIADRITELRLRKNVSEYQMSLDLGKNKSYIQNISSGRSMPSMGQFLEICNYFDIRHSSSLMKNSTISHFIRKRQTF